MTGTSHAWVIGKWLWIVQAVVLLAMGLLYATVDVDSGLRAVVIGIGAVTIIGGLAVAYLGPHARRDPGSWLDRLTIVQLILVLLGVAGALVLPGYAIVLLFDLLGLAGCFVTRREVAASAAGPRK